MHKSLPKTNDSSVNTSLTKKTLLKKDLSKNTIVPLQNNTEYLNSKFYKVHKNEKIK